MRAQPRAPARSRTDAGGRIRQPGRIRHPAGHPHILIPFHSHLPEGLRRMDRRRFLKTALAAPASLAIPEVTRRCSTRSRSGWDYWPRLVRQNRPDPAACSGAGGSGIDVATSTSTCSTRRRTSSKRARVRRKRPRTYADYRKMLAERDLDIVLIADARPLACIADDRSGEGGLRRVPTEAHQRRCDRRRGDAGGGAQVRTRGAGGLQRRSTPHLVEARDQIIREGKLGKIGLVEIYCYYPMRLNGMPRISRRPNTWTGTPGPARAAGGPITRSSIPASGALTRSIATASSATCACTCSI